MLKIASFNIKNDYNYYTEQKTNTIYEFLEREKIDILCLQEVYDKCSNDLCKILRNKDFKMYGNYRFKLGVFHKINEKTPVITRNGKNTKTVHLPYLPSLLKRVITKVDVDTEYGVVAVYNTHLDFKYDIVKKRQLKSILKILKKEKKPIILVGDFNTKINKNFFKDFIYELEKLGIKRVEINKKTLKQSKYNQAIDHIFISNCFNVVEKKVVENLEISDHYPIVVKISL